MAAMTTIPQFLPRGRRGQTSSRTVLFVAFEGMGLLDLTGSTTVFWSAASFMKQQRQPGYSLHVVSMDGGLIFTEEGISIATSPISDFAKAAIDTIVVPGAFNMEPVLRNRRLVDWLRVTSPKARRTASVCAGAFLLADAGLLHERRATTHSSSCALLGERYPSLRVIKGGQSRRYSNVIFAFSSTCRYFDHIGRFLNERDI
jgi:transcriptional regulator GlxA family with amidase domain